MTLGTNRNDYLQAAAEGDLVLGLAGDDHLSTRFDDATLSGGTGDDTF